MKKIILTILILCAMVCATVKAEVHIGYCGASPDTTRVSWVFNTESGSLKIFGQGDMGKTIPWKTYKDAITSVQICEGVTSIGPFAFAHCNNLRSVSIPRSMEVIHSKSFAYTAITSFHVGSLKKLGCSVFDLCKQLTSVVFGDTVVDFGGSNFAQCTRLNHVVMPKVTRHIALDNFIMCFALPIVDGLHYADTYLVRYDENAPRESYTIREGTKWIRDHAFSNCETLTSVTIPQSVLAIGNLTFLNCTNLKSITCKALTPPYLSLNLNTAIPDCFKGVDCSKIILYVPKQSVEAYKSATIWKDFIIKPMNSR